MDRLVGDPVGFLMHLVLVAPALLLAVTIHEVAHGWVADRLGDPTARLAGRLTMNPLPHIDPVGALAFVISSLYGVGFGWAKPVPVNARNLRHPVRDMALVGAAGPASNFVAGFLALVAFRLVQRIPDQPFVAEPLAGVLYYAFMLNVGLGIFNLIPLPPLDGGHFLPYFLPRSAYPLLRQLQQYGPIILIMLVVFGGTRYVIGPLFFLIRELYLSIIQAIF
jgi:Zn-dependent protease